MKRRIQILGAGALILSLALFAGHAVACGTQVPVSGTQSLTIADPGDQWTDDDGVLHYRGFVQVAQIEGTDADGVPVSGVGTYVHRIDVDTVTGNGYMFLRMSTDMIYGDREGSWRGFAFGPIEAWNYDIRFFYVRGRGDFARWRFVGNVMGFMPVPVSDWEGTFYVPGGGGGHDKAVAVEDHTLSDVKALFR